MRLAGLFLLAVVCSGIRVAAQEPEAGARLLTVEIFSAHRISTLNVTPLGKNESMRTCSACRARAVTVPFTAKLRANGIVLSSGVQVREADLDGAFRVQPDGEAREISAAGVWKLAVVHGELRVLLTLDSERYVELALNGEAAANEPLESLKAMAAAVRTYALENADRHASEGFNLCDSTHCQALRFGQPSATVEQAVLETAGETLWYGGRRAAVFYTQNCGGQSEDAANVWPGTRIAYLSAHADPWCTRHGAAEWHADISLEQMRAVFRSQGWNLPARVDAVGVVKRTAAGRAEQLEFSGAGVRTPVTASSFRFALDRALGWNQLRSDWYTVTLSNGTLHFQGRGYGHGVGLCQAGALEMAAEGHSWREILNFYFPGTSVGVSAQDRGWQSARGTGWTLWTTMPSPDLVKEGNAAWGKAQSLFPPRVPVQPEVWQYPTTELFRQSTNEPGWVLASTRGAEMFLQPDTVLKKTGREENTLLHEFLHVLVEEEASPRAPLWLREGIVEVLADGSVVHGANGAAASAGDLDSALAHPANQEDSQRAHTRAGMLARALISRYGMEQMRQWLRAGSVPDAATTSLVQSPGQVPGRSPSTQR